MTDHVLAHYRILERLGAGGMGEVHRAHDTKLGRDVGLKLLPAEMVGDAEARARLVREARTASALNHPNICTIYEVGEADGQAYIAMELLRGATIAESIPAHGLPAETVIRYGAQIADALAHAHDHGVIHRDLKSSNVMVTPEGRVKVLDFGLARSGMAAPDDSTRGVDSRSQPGRIVGTPQYLAPEVLRGATADARSDLWALGIMLYEMSTRVLPFSGVSVAELSAAILSAVPAPLPASLPAGLRGVIQRCLAKDPAQRYRNAGEVRSALESVLAGLETSPRARRAPGGAHAAVWIAAGAIALVVALGLLNVGGVRDRLLGGGGARRIRSLAVLPLENLSRDPDQEYFADGMTDELITSLAGLTDVRVISRTSTMRYKNTTRSIPQIARELGVDAIVEGSAMRSGNEVRITAQLIAAPEDRHLWANHYERGLENVLAMQDEVARAIAGEIRATLAPPAGTTARAPRTVDPRAYEAYLRGRFAWNLRTPVGIDEALTQFRRAIAIDSTYAQAYAGLASTFAILPGYSMVPPNESYPRARTAALKALSLDERLSEAHAVLGSVKLFYEWDWKGAEAEYRRAIELDPSDAVAHQWYSNYLAAASRPAEAMREIETARACDPLSPMIQNARAVRLTEQGRFDEAVAACRQVIHTNPGFPMAYIQLGDIYIHTDRLNEGIRTFAVADSINGAPPGEAAELMRAVATDGDRGFWSAGIRIVERRLKRGEPIPRVLLAQNYVHLGELDRALDVLEECADAHADDVVELNIGQDWKPLRSLPRFHALLRRVGLEPAS